MNRTGTAVPSVERGAMSPGCGMTFAILEVNDSEVVFGINPHIPV